MIYIMLLCQYYYEGTHITVMFKTGRKTKLDTITYQTISIYKVFM